MSQRISIIVPVYNEEVAVVPFFEELNKHLTYPKTTFEVIFINDGSTDTTQSKLEEIATHDSRVRVLSFSRNFGKEAATTAGFRESTGDAVIALDADLQHPPHLIPEFIKKWQAGNEVVIGIRTNNASDSFLKRICSRLYYKIMNSISETEIIPSATDFRLVDRQVVDIFNKMSERNRMTRSLIDWLGYTRDYIHFEASERLHGAASYSTWKLVKLATESFISHSFVPLRLTGYLGVVITFFAGLLGVVMFIDRFIISFGFNFSGPAILATIILFLVGIILVSLGLFSFYIAQIHRETQNRPLYVLRKEK